MSAANCSLSVALESFIDFHLDSTRCCACTETCITVRIAWVFCPFGPGEESLRFFCIDRRWFGYFWAWHLEILMERRVPPLSWGLHPGLRCLKCYPLSNYEVYLLTSVVVASNPAVPLPLPLKVCWSNLCSRRAQHFLRNRRLSTVIWQMSTIRLKLNN